jgi:hypothetical protein
MTRSRRQLSGAEELALTTQVEAVCPICGVGLFRRKGRKEFKDYEIAHIYPLNPTVEERIVLNGLRKLNEDPNHLDNLIPLCSGCHSAFDKPRTADEYLALIDKKEALIAVLEQRKLQHFYFLQDEVSRIVEALDSDDYTAANVILSLEAKPIDEKFDSTMPPQLRRKIRRAVSEFFSDVRERFQNLDKERPGVSDLISAQVKAFYKAQRVNQWTQQQIFTSVTDWIQKRTNAKTREAAEIVAAFFVQNCEVFE